MIICKCKALISGLVNIRAQLKRLPKSSELSGKTVVFNTVRSFTTPLVQELFLAHIYASKGCRCIIILDDGMLDHWDTYQVHHGDVALSPFRGNGVAKFRHCLIRSMYLWAYAHKDISIKYYSELLHDTAIDAMLDCGDKDDAISSARRFFETGSFEPNDPRQSAYYEMSLKNSALSRLVASAAYDEYHPSLFVTSHGIYSLWGAAFAFFKEKGAQAIVYGAHTYTRQSIFISDTITQILEYDSDWNDRAKGVNISREQSKRVDDLFEERMSHRAADTKIYYEGSAPAIESTIRFPRNPGQRNFCMFPNVIWDGDVVERDMYFNGIVDWMVETISAFRHSPHRLIIRFHPAEASLWKNSVSAFSAIERIIPDLRSWENVALIFANERVDTYTFARDNIDVALVYDGVLALEMPYLGIPVVTPANGRFPGGSFIAKPKTKNAYLSMLSNPDGYISSFCENLAVCRKELREFSHWFFFDAAYYMPLFQKDRINEFRLSDLSGDEVCGCGNPEFERTVAKLMSFIR